MAEFQEYYYHHPYANELDTVVLSCHACKGGYKVILKDNWVWIKKDELEKIFDRFYRNSDSNIYNKNWSWLGLTIVKKICDDFGWEIYISSEIWVWSTFEIIFKQNNLF